MEGQGLVVWIIVGAVAGWLAGTLVKGGGFGLVGDIIIGILGGFIGGWLSSILGIHIGSGLVASIVTATMGAALFIMALRALKAG
jgi:uncharacterized membrane protein YeaQ/YmgE (transglycosylase-associated protein family)